MAMSVVTNFFLGLASIGGAYFWAKTQLIKPDLITERDLISSRGVPLAKRARTETGGASGYDKTIETAFSAANGEGSKHETVVETVGKAKPVVELVAEIATAAIKADTDWVPEDSVLKRHHLARRATEREAITHPYPTDSVLRRHRESMLAFNILPDRISEPQAEVIESCITASEPLVIAKTGVDIPEDSVLKRHFLAQLQAQIEQDLPAKPSDATLKRHYAQLLQSKLDAFLL